MLVCKYFKLDGLISSTDYIHADWPATAVGMRAGKKAFPGSVELTHQLSLRCERVVEMISKRSSSDGK